MKPEKPHPWPGKQLYATVPETIVPACMLERDYVRLGILYFVCLRQRAGWSYSILTTLRAGRA